MGCRSWSTLFFFCSSLTLVSFSYCQLVFSFFLCICWQWTQVVFLWIWRFLETTGHLLFLVNRQSFTGLTSHDSRFIPFSFGVMREVISLGSELHHWNNVLLLETSSSWKQ